MKAENLEKLDAEKITVSKHNLDAKLANSFLDEILISF